MWTKQYPVSIVAQSLVIFDTVLVRTINYYTIVIIRRFLSYHHIIQLANYIHAQNKSFHIRILKRYSLDLKAVIKFHGVPPSTHYTHTHIVFWCWCVYIFCALKHYGFPYWWPGKRVWNKWNVFHFLIFSFINDLSYRVSCYGCVLLMSSSQPSLCLILFCFSFSFIFSSLIIIDSAKCDYIIYDHFDSRCQNKNNNNNYRNISTKCYL